MTDRSSVALRTIGSRQTLTGSGDALQNVNTETLDDGCRCYVTADHSEWQLRKDSVASPSGTVLVPSAGPGRWLKNAGSGAQGAQGAQGSQGGGGGVSPPFPVSYLDTTGISDGKIVVVSSGVAVWGDVPVAFDITGFGHSPSLVQVGATVTNPSFTASYNQSATSVSLTDTEAHSDVITLPGTSFISPHAFTKTVHGQSVTFTLHAENALGTDTANTGISWGSNVYYGAVVDPGTYNEAFVESLTASLKLGAGGTYGFNATSGQSSFFCALSSLGLTINDFYVDGFPFACSIVATGLSITNSDGIPQNYDVIRSDNTGLGDFDLAVV